MLEKFKSYRTLATLRNSNAINSFKDSDEARRKKVSIGVIDDKTFEAKQNLENLGYNITFLSDPQRLNVVVPHHIILCDLQGVGQQLDTKKQGAFIIGEIKRNYPEKFVVAYTGGTLDHQVAREAMDRADSFQRKDANIEEWRDKLDDMIQRLLDPVEVWKRQRIALANTDADTLDILKLEDAYVTSVLRKDHSAESAFNLAVNSSAIKGDARAVVTSLIASGLFKIMVGS